MDLTHRAVLPPSSRETCSQLVRILLLKSTSIITVLADSLVKFESAAMAIDRGGVDVSISKHVGATTGDVNVKLASLLWTEFNVVDVGP